MNSDDKNRDAGGKKDAGGKARDSRRAAALRANLKRRKQQSRARSPAPEPRK